MNEVNQNIKYWPLCPQCGAAVDCIGRGDIIDEFNRGNGKWKFRCKLNLSPFSAAPKNGHVFTMSTEKLESIQEQRKHEVINGK